MKKNIITALLITIMISTMAACGNKSDVDAVDETVMVTTEVVENPTADADKVIVGTVNKDENANVATVPLTDEKMPVENTTHSPEVKSTDAPETTEKPKSTAKPGTTPAPKSTPTPKATATPKATEVPVPSATPAPVETPVITSAPAATPVSSCPHTSTHVENAHDTYKVPISGGCSEIWRYATRVCNDCGYNFGEAPDHINDEHAGYHVITPGRTRTCTEAGAKETATCDCGFMYWETGDDGPAFGHDYVREWDHDETDEEGKDHVYFHSICRGCGDISSVWEE